MKFLLYGPSRHEAKISVRSAAHFTAKPEQARLLSCFIIWLEIGKAFDIVEKFYIAYMTWEKSCNARGRWIPDR